MKKIILATAAVIALSFSSMAGNDEASDKYCAKMKDGKMVIMHQGNIVGADVTLDNGAIVKVDGTIVMKDGSKMTLTDGQCINKDGSTTIPTGPSK